MEIGECIWSDVFDESERKSLEGGLFLAGLASVLLGLWLNLSILLTNLRLDQSYRNLANFTIIACMRKLLPLVGHLPLFQIVQGTQEFDLIRCEFIAFLETFLAVYEVEWLTHVCIERYVVAKYTINGWPIQKYHYKLFHCICLFFASLYSFPPLLGVGRYGLDLTCTFCTFDMILPDSWQRYVVVMIFLLRSIKPALVMLIMLTWARILEKKLACSVETQKQTDLTKNVIIITLINQFCWFPIAIIRGWVLLSQLIYSYPVVPASMLYIKWAMWIHWVAPAFTAIALFFADGRVRDNMLQLHAAKNADQIDNKKTH